MIDYPKTLGLYLAALNPPRPLASAVDRGDGDIELHWPKEYGDPPSADVVKSWQPVINRVSTMSDAFASAVSQAQSNIIAIKARVWDALVEAEIAPDEATALGVQFALTPAIKSAISDYEIAGGHPIAAELLLSAVQAQADNFAWLKLPSVAAVFKAALS